MVHIIGEVAIAERQMELRRSTMRSSKDAEEYAHNKMEFRKARNRVLALKEKIN